MMLDQKNNEHTEERASTQKSEMISRERRNTRSFGSVCSDSFDDLWENNGAKANSLGRLFGRLSLLYVGVSLY
jgi:hypothetical protein